MSENFTANPFEYEFVALPVSMETPVLSVSYLQGLTIVDDSGEYRVQQYTLAHHQV